MGLGGWIWLIFLKRRIQNDLIARRIAITLPETRTPAVILRFMDSVTKIGRYGKVTSGQEKCRQTLAGATRHSSFQCRGTLQVPLYRSDRHQTPCSRLTV